MLIAERPEAPAEFVIGRDTARDHECQRLGVPLAKHPDRLLCSVENRIADRRLERRTDVGDILLRERSKRCDGVPNGSLEAREREIRVGPPDHGPRQSEASRITLKRRALDRWPAGIAKAKHPGDLVECFSDRIVNRAAETMVTPDTFDDQKLAMPARDEKEEIGKINIRDEAGREGVAFQMIDREKWQAVNKGNGLGHCRADNEPADQTRSAGRRDAGKRREVQPGLGHHAADHPVEVDKMGPGGDLRNDAAILAVFGRLRQHGLRSHGPLVIDKRDGRLITACLDAKNHHIQAQFSREGDCACG